MNEFSCPLLKSVATFFCKYFIVYVISSCYPIEKLVDWLKLVSHLIPKTGEAYAI